MVSAFRSTATYIALALYVLLIGPPFVLIAILFGKRALLGRAYMFMDAQAPKVVRIERASA